jgi:hypothetical protein
MNRRIDHPILQCPCSQGKELFPATLAWHQMWTGGRVAAHPIYGIPRLAWTVACWDRMTAPLPPPNPTLPDPNDLNILSNLRDTMSNKEMKLTHPTTELILEIRNGDKLDKSRNLKALIDTGSFGCIIRNEFTKGVHHKKVKIPSNG